MIFSLGHNRFLLAGGGILVILALLAAFAPLLSPYDPIAQFDRGLDANGMPLPPDATFLLGTDTLGRDVLSRLIYGSRVSLVVGTVAMAVAMVIGVAIGLVAGYFGRMLDSLLMRFTDVMMTFPSLLLAMALVAVWRPGITNVFIVIGVVSWTGVARVIRGEILTLREREFIQSARALGAPHRRVMLAHLLPNLLPTIIALAFLSTSSTILLDAGLSFLGIGVPPPEPSWGTMIFEAQSFYRAAPWLLLEPGLAIFVAILGFNLVGHGLLDLFSVRRA